jgi:hypothetical protein
MAAFVLVGFYGRVDVGDTRTLDASHLSRKGSQDLRIIVERWLTTGNGVEQLLLRSNFQSHFCLLLSTDIPSFMY